MKVLIYCKLYISFNDKETREKTNFVLAKNLVELAIREKILKFHGTASLRHDSNLNLK